MITPAPAPAPKRRMVFDGVFLPPPPPAEWLEGAILFPVSRAKKQKKGQSDDLDLERPKKKQRTSGARVESPIELDQDEDYSPFANNSDDDDKPLPPPEKMKMKNSPTKPRPRRPRKTKTKVVDTTMKTPDELRKAERVAQERVCHQCRNMKKNTTARRVPCGRKNCTFAYCERCLELRYDYASTSLTSPPTGACPSCRGNCNCSVCLTKRGLEDHMPHLRALAKDWDKRREGAVCPRVWLEREGLLVEEVREVESGRWVVDERDAEVYDERARKERVEMVRSVRRWYVGLPPPPLRRVRDVPSAPSTIDGDDDEGEGEKDSLFDGPYTPDAPAPAPVPVPEQRDSLFDGSCTPLTPSEQDKDPALSLEEDNDKDSLFDGPFTWDDLDSNTDSPEDALRVETELALVLGDDDAEASTDPDYVDAVVREGIIGTRERDEDGVYVELPVKKSRKMEEEFSGLLGDMSDLSTPTPSLTASNSNSTLHETNNSTLKASLSACTVATVSSSVTATQPAQEGDDRGDDEPDEHPDYDCSHLRRPFVSCNPPRIVGLPLRWVPARAPAPASGLELVPKRKRKSVQQQKSVVKRSRAYEEDEDAYTYDDEDDDSEVLSLYTDGSSDDGADAFSLSRRGAGGVRRRRGKASARTHKHEDSSSPSSRSPKTPHPHPSLVDPYYYTDTSTYSYSYPPDPTPTEPVFVPDEVVDESMRGSKADDVFLLPAPGPVEFGWDDEDGDGEGGRMAIDVEAVADAWKSLGAIGIGL